MSLSRAASLASNSESELAMLLALLLRVRSRMLLTLLLPVLEVESDELPRLTGNLKSLLEDGGKVALLAMFDGNGMDWC